MDIDFHQLDDVRPNDIIKMRFKPTAIDDLVYLQAMKAADVITLRLGDEITVMAVLNSRDWDQDANRTIEARVGTNWSLDFFVGRMWHALEYIEVLMYGPGQPSPGQLCG